MRSVGGRRLILIVAILGVGLALTQQPAYAATDTITFEELVPPENRSIVLTDHYRQRGVLFDRVELFRCSAITRCPKGPRSGTNVSASPRAGEFQQDPYRADFTFGQKRVSAYVVWAEDFGRPREVEVTMTAFSAGIRVGEQAVRFSSDAGWQPITVRSAFDDSVITSVVLRGIAAGVGSTTNFFQVEDLTFESDATLPPPPPTDGRVPRITINEPAEGETIRSRSVDIATRVEDDRSLRRVTAELVHAASRTQIASVDLCGTSDAGACPTAPPSPVVLERRFTLELREDLQGSHTVTVRACDAAGNCSIAPRNFNVNIPAPPPDTPVRGWRIEVNQGIQGRPTPVPEIGTSEASQSTARLVPGRDTVIRYYLLASGADRPNYSAELLVRIERTDGTTAFRRLDPNAAPTTITVPQNPGADGLADLELAMRADLTRTLNFVLPGRFLEGTRALELTLRDDRAVTGTARFAFGPPARVGLNIVRTRNRSTTLPSNANVASGILTYLQKAYPATEVRIVSNKSMRVGFNEPLYWPGSSCSWVLHQVWAAYGTDDAPVQGMGPDPSILPTVGVIPPGPLGNTQGCSYIGDPDDYWDRIGGTVITTVNGDTAAQEIAHRMGLIHAGNSHGEAGGGDTENWPFPHGGIDANSTSFGVIPVEAANSGELGRWTIGLVDPCPGATAPANRRPCDIPDSQQVHDYMSYGSSSTPLPLAGMLTRSNRWTSSTTYNRIYDAIVDGRAPDLRAARSASIRAEDERVDALLVHAIADEHGSTALTPLDRKPVLATAVSDAPLSEYTVELRGETGTVLAAGPARARELTSHDSHEIAIDAVLPYVTGVREVVVQQGGQPVATMTASPSTPKARIVTPRPGAVLADGVHEVSWESSDADGDSLLFFVQYSPDDGQTWEPIGVATDASMSLDFFVDDATPSRRGRIRVMTSDGVNTTLTTTDCISVGTDEKPECSRPVDIKPGSCPNPFNASSKGVLPVAVMGTADADPALIDRSTLRLNGVPALRSSLDDVGAPHEARPGERQADDCSTAGPDGTTDLVLHFDSARVAKSLGFVREGEVRTLPLTGVIRTKDGQASFTGEDVIVVIKKGASQLPPPDTTTPP